MPILEIQIVTRKGEKIADELAQSIATELGTVLRIRSSGLWVRVHAVPPGQYAENAAGEAPAPVFASWLESDRPVGDTLTKRIAAITKSLARLTGRPAENIHVLFEPAARGRLAFGGELLE